VLDEAHSLATQVAALRASLELDVLAAKEVVNRVEEDRRDNATLFEALRGNGNKEWPRR
jgi:hypothetical protein